MALFTDRKMLCALLTGLLLTASFPPGRLEWLAWIALIPLIKALDGVTPLQAFRLGFMAGFIHFLTLIYWIVVVMGQYGGLPLPVSVSILVLLCLVLSLYPGVFACLASTLKGTPFFPFLAASIWVGLEYLRANLLTGFPWCLLGYSQYKQLPLIQISGLTGVYGLSFLILLCNGWVYSLVFEKPFKKKGWSLRVLVIPPVLVFLTLAYGHYRLTQNTYQKEEVASIRTAIIQGNVDQSVKWQPVYQKKTIEGYQNLTLQTRSFHPQLVVWPETALPFFFQDRSPLSKKVMATIKKMDCPFVFGSPAYSGTKGNIRYYNRAYLHSSSGRVLGTYDKIHLVPFGEYVPLKRFLPFVHRLVPAAGDFSSGEKSEPLPLSPFPSGVLICYEAIFPELARSQVRHGAAILINLTNDAWFGPTSAPYQHLAMAVFRAVETGRPLIRAANTGFSAVIGPQGRILKQSGLFVEEVLTVEVPVDQGMARPYTRFGDLFAIVLLGITFLCALFCFRRAMKGRAL